MPDIGDLAPDFALKNTKGETIRLGELRDLKRALLIFYPKDKTSG